MDINYSCKKHNIKPLEELSEEIGHLEHHLDVTGYDITLCHNDLWHPNIIYNEDEGTRSSHFQFVVLFVNKHDKH